MQCNVKDCSYYSFPNSDKCSRHCDNSLFDSSNTYYYVKTVHLCQKYDSVTKDIIINKNEEKSMKNIKKSISKNECEKIMKIYSAYLKCINKKYINASLARDLVDYCKLNNESNIVHHIYAQVGDWWNIGKNDLGVAYCYYGDWDIRENILVKGELMEKFPRPPKTPFA